MENKHLKDNYPNTLPTSEHPFSPPKNLKFVRKIFSFFKKGPQPPNLELPNNFTTNSHAELELLKKELKKNDTRQKIKISILIFCLALYGVLTYIFKNNISTSFIEIVPQNYFIFSNIILLVAFLTTIKKSCKLKQINQYLLKGKISLSILYFIMCIRNLYPLIFKTQSSLTNETLFSIPLIFLLFFIISEFFCSRRILKSLKFVAAKNPKYLIERHEKNTISESLLKNISTPKPVTATRISIEKLSNFVKASLHTTFLKKYSNIFLSIVAVFAITLGILSFFLFKDVFYSLNCLIISLLICAPLPWEIILTFKFYCICQKAIKKGILITNHDVAKHYSTVNTIVLDAAKLYPPQDIILREIKTFHGQRVDQAILYAAALLSAKGSQLSRVFDKIIMGQKKMLRKVSEVIYEENMGISGWVDGQRVVVGNRKILKKYKIAPPKREYENKYLKSNTGLVYTAIGEELVAMFILEYKPNKKIQKTLIKALKQGIEILIKTTDINITPKRITLDFMLPYDLIKILPDSDDSYFNSPLQETKREETSLFVSCGDDALLKAIVFCKSINKITKMLISLQGISLGISMIICAMLAFFGSIDRISELNFMIYMLFWLFASSLCSKLA